MQRTEVRDETELVDLEQSARRDREHGRRAALICEKPSLACEIAREIAPRSHSDRTQIALSRMHLLWFCRANLPNMAPSRMTRTSVVSGALPSAAALAAASMASAVAGSATSRMVTMHWPACRMYLMRCAIRLHQ